MKSSRLTVFLLSMLCILIAGSSFGQTPAKDLVYKKIDTTSLHLKIYYPRSYLKGKKYPAIVFFSGADWNTGSITQFQEQARYFSTRGMIGINANYSRLKGNRKNLSEPVSDAKSAIRYLRQHAEELGIDADKLAAGGASAGAQLAAAADLSPDYNKDEDQKISSRPNALLLFNPLLHTGTESLLQHIKPGEAPSIVFFGTNDQLVPIDTARKYQELMKKNGNRCELLLYEGQVHGFANYRPAGDSYYYLLTLSKANAFLKSLGYLKE